MIRNIIRLLFGIFLLLGVVASGVSQTQKIGYVNSTKILQEYPEAIDAQKKIDAQGKSWQNELEKMSKEYQDKLEAYQKKEGMLSDAAKKDQQTELLSLQEKGLQFRQQKFGAEGDLAVLTDSLLSPIKKKVIKVIEQVAKDEKLQFIFDRNDNILVLLYGDAKYDYTNLVIDRLKRGITK